MSDAAVNVNPADVGKPGYLDLMLSPTGDLQLTSGSQETQQAVTLRLLASVEDFFLDMDAGVPWHDGLFQSRQGLTPAFEALLQNTILSTPGILGLITWETTTRRGFSTLLIKFQAQAATGVINFSVSATPPGA